MAVVYSVCWHGYMLDDASAETEGGELVSDVLDCSHAVLRHREQGSYFKAKEQQDLGEDMRIVTAEWVLLSSVRKEMLPEVSQLGAHGSEP